MIDQQHQSELRADDEIYLKIWEVEQEHMRTRWTIATFFISVSFGILGFSFQPTLAPTAASILRIVGLLMYWFAYVLFAHFYRYSRFLRSYLTEMETSNRTVIRLHLESKRAEMMLLQKGERRLRTLHLLAGFGALYTVGVALIWVLRI